METIELLKDTVFDKMPTLSHDRTVVLFMEMDTIMNRCIQHTFFTAFIVDQILTIASKIAAGKTHGKMLFNRNIKNDGVGIKNKMKHVCKSQPCLNLNPKKFYYYNNKPDVEMVSFLEKAMRVHSLWTANNLKYSDIKGLGLNRATYEGILKEFIEVTHGYVESCMKYSFLINENNPELHPEIKKLEKELTIIEHRIGIGRNQLFGICKILESELARYLKIRNIIFKPYLRIVFNEAKKRAASDQQTLDNFQHGAVGLLNAISNSNNPRGVFSSYAKQWVKQRILLKLKNEANFIRMPISSWQTNNILSTTIEKETSNDEETVDIESISKKTGIKEKKVAEILDRFRSTKVVNIENETTIDIRQEVESVEEEEIDLSGYFKLLTDEQSFIVKLLHGMFELLPGDFPTDPVRIEMERKRQQGFLA